MDYGFLPLDFFDDKFIETVRKWPYTKFEKCDPMLGTINGIGLSLCGGSGRYDYSTSSTISFSVFSFLLYHLVAIEPKKFQTMEREHLKESMGMKSGEFGK